MSNAFFGVRRCNTTPGAAALVALAVLASAGCDKSTPAPKGHGAADAGVAVSRSALLGSGCTSATYNGHDYLLCTSAKSWDAARSDCIASGMELVKIDDAAENTFVKQHAPGFGSSWIGATDAAAQGTWKWSVDGSVLGYTNWSFLQPDGFLHEDCANLQQFDGDWNATLCSLSLPYVCEEIPPVTPPPPVTADTSCWNSASLQKDSPWPMRGLCPLRRGASKFVGSQVNTINWTFPSGAIRTAVAIGVDGTLYYGSEDSYLYAVTKTGTQRWRFHTSGAVRSSPALTANGLVIFGSEDHFLYGLDANTGAQRFRTDLHGAVTSSPTVAADGTIVVGADDDRIHALDGSTGAERWSYLTGADVDSSPAIGPDGTIYCGSDDDKLVALRPDPGLTDAQRLRWAVNLGSDINAAPVIGPAPDNAIYVRTQNSSVVKLAAADGHQLASFQGPTDPDADGSLALGLDGTLYAALEHKLYALHPDLTVAWLFSTGGDVRTTPSVGADGVIYFGADDQKFYAVKPNGSALWSVTSSAWFGQGAFRGSAAIGKSGTIYCGSDEGKLYAIGSFACSTAHPCTNGMGPCTADCGCGVGLSCGYGVAERFGLPADFGVCWDPKDCATFAPADCGNFRTQCGDCCVPNCSSAGSSDHCGHTCQACVPGADTDKDGILDCDEYADGSDWTNALVANGVRAQQGPSCSASPTCGAIDTEAEIAACFIPAESQVLSSGWNFSTPSQNLCDAGFGFSPTWSSCRDDFAVDYSTVLRLEQGGRHCFLLGGSTTSQCASLFVEGLTGSPGVTLQTTTGNAVCADLAAGSYNLHWFYENAGPASNALSVQHCFGGTTDCAPTLPIATKELLPPGPVPACDARPTVCSERCPCSTGQVCDPTKPNGLCGAGLECNTGVGDRFGLAASTPVCWDGPICDNWRSSSFSCGTPSARCGTVCPTCTPSCGGKSCGYDGCWGSCGGTCNSDEAGCRSDADCIPGDVCIADAGPAFGKPQGLNVCAPADCRSLTTSNPCLNPINQGRTTICGVCPALMPNCAGKVCGDDGAGGSCGPTPAGDVCINGTPGHSSSFILGSSLHPPLPGRVEPNLVTSGVGTIPGQFAVSHTGEATYSLPIHLPPGRGGMTPELGLSYRSGRGNGLLGVGWALDGMQSITRCARTIARDQRAAPVKFVDGTPADPEGGDAYCLNGERLIRVGTKAVNGQDVTRFALEHNDFSEILEFDYPAGKTLTGPERFQVTKRDGRVLSFGGDETSSPDSESSRILAPDQFKVVQTWALSQVADRDKNYARFGYTQVSNGSGSNPLSREYYPWFITYSLHPTDNAPQGIVFFTYEHRPDIQSGWHGGVDMEVSMRLQQVIILSYGENRHYLVTYETGTPGVPEQSRITSVQECADESAGSLSRIQDIPTTCLPATTFTYERADTSTAPVTTQSSMLNDETKSIEVIADFDGDGRDDFLMLDKSGPTEALQLSRTAPDGTVTFVENRLSACPHCDKRADNISGHPRPTDLRVLDWDGDGLQDVFDLRLHWLYRLIHNPNMPGTFDFESSLPANATGFSGSLSAQNFMLDLDGDGLSDFLACQGGQWQYALRRRPPYSASNSTDMSRDDWHDLNGISAGCPASVGSTSNPGEEQQGHITGTFLSNIADNSNFLGAVAYDQVVDLDGDGAQELLFVVDDQVGALDDRDRPSPRGYASGYPTVDSAPGIPYFSQPRQGLTWLSLHIAVNAGAVISAHVEDTGVPWQAKLLDMNGDGLPDFYWLDACLQYGNANYVSDEVCSTYSSAKNLRSWTNLGGRVVSTQGVGPNGLARFSENSIAQPELLGLAPNEVTGAARLSRVFDYNGDGRQDILLPDGNTWEVLLSTGSGFATTGVSLDWPWTHRDRPCSGTGCSADILALHWAAQASEEPTLLDLDGNGLSDVLKHGGSGYQIMLRKGPLNPRLSTVTNGLGELTSVTYGQLDAPSGGLYTPRGDNVACHYPQTCRTPRGSVVSEYTLGTAAVGNQAPVLKQHYAETYADARADVQGRGFLGFRQRREDMYPIHGAISPLTSPSGIFVTTEYSFDNESRDSATGIYYNALTPYFTSENRSDGTLLSFSSTSIESRPIVASDAPGTVFRSETRRIEYASEDNQVANTSAVVRNWGRWTSQIDDFGNPKVVVEGPSNLQTEGSSCDETQGCRLIETDSLPLVNLSEVKSCDEAG